MFEVVLSAVGFGFAAWALLGPAATEHIRVKIKERAGVLGTIGVLVLILMLAYPFVHAAIPAESAQVRDWAEAAGRSIVVLLIALAALLVWPGRKWSASQLERFHRRVESLILTGRAATVVDVLRTAFPDLPRRWRRGGEDPDPDPAAESFDEVLEDALVHTEFIRAAARHDRAFLANLFTHKSTAGLFASDEILQELMFGPDRLLPRELMSTRDYSGDRRHQYRIPERCIILHALFDDIHVADELACWEGIGDGVIKHIASQAGRQLLDPDQRPFVVEYEDARWGSPVGCGIWFFRLMLTSAIKQSHDDSMWIAYLAHFIDEIDQVIKVPAGHEEREFPNAYCYWVYDCLQCCLDVLRVVAEVDDDNLNRRVVLDGEGRRAGAIDGVLHAYGMCLSAVMRTRNLPNRFKQYCISGIILAFRDWGRGRYPAGFQEYAIDGLRMALSPDEFEAVAQRVEAAQPNPIEARQNARLCQMLRAAAQPRGPLPAQDDE